MTFDWFQFIANVIVIPMAGLLWSIQGRLSKIEGHLNAIEKSK